MRSFVGLSAPQTLLAVTPAAGVYELWVRGLTPADLEAACGAAVAAQQAHTAGVQLAEGNQPESSRQALKPFFRAQALGRDAGVPEGPDRARGRPGSAEGEQARRRTSACHLIVPSVRRPGSGFFARGEMAGVVSPPSHRSTAVDRRSAARIDRKPPTLSDDRQPQSTRSIQ